jgi:hypothetical protein
MAQLADGVMPGQNASFKTSFTFLNETVYPSSGNLEFFDDAGNPLTVTVDGVTGSTIPVALQPGQTRRLTTSGAGAAKVGWARLLTDQPIEGTASFTMTTAGQLVADVGVGESLLATELRLYVDTRGQADTGVALVNPDNADPLDFTLELYSPTGTLISQRAINLPRRGHIARYATELFNTVPGINEFEGSLVIRAPRPFAGITLRSAGVLLTSVPLAAPPAPGDTRNRLVFPQAADGLIGAVRYTTTIVLLNNTGKPASGTIHFVGPTGAPLSVGIGGVTASTFNFALPVNGTGRWTTSGTGAAQVGWASVSMDQPLAGGGIFQLYRQNGQLISEVGVADTSPGELMTLVADSIGSSSTGLAIANPSEEDDVTVTLRLFDSQGGTVANQQVNLAPGQHRALFFEELYTGVAGVSEMLGRLSVSAGDPVAAMTLRMTGELLTSAPNLTPQHGFAPLCAIQFAQNLIGESPTVVWGVETLAADLALETLRVEAAGLTLDPTVTQPGEEIGYGVYLFRLGQASVGGIVKLIYTRSGSIQFDAVASGTLVAPGATLFSGQLEALPGGGVGLQINPLGTGLQDWNSGVGVEFDINLKAGLIRAPATAQTVEVVTTCRSAQIKPGEAETRMTRVIRQPASFVAPVAGAPRLVNQRPALFSPGVRAVLSGGGWADSPEVKFPSAGGESKAFVLSRTADTLEVLAPLDAISGLARIRQGQSSSNTLEVRTLYTPSCQLTRKTGAKAGEFSLDLVATQPAVQLVTQAFDLRVFNALWATQGLAAGQRVGDVEVQSGSSLTKYVVRVGSVSDSEIGLEIAKDLDDSADWLLRLGKAGADGKAGALLQWRPQSIPEIPSVNGNTWRLHVNLDGVVFAPDAAGAPITWLVDSTSCAADLWGSTTGLTVHQGLQDLQ